MEVSLFSKLVEMDESAGFLHALDLSGALVSGASENEVCIVGFLSMNTNPYSSGAP